MSEKLNHEINNPDSISKEKILSEAAKLIKYHRHNHELWVKIHDSKPLYNEMKYDEPINYEFGMHFGKTILLVQLGFTEDEITHAIDKA